ncbi:MAG: glycosyltransferase family 4 protein, partial [Bacteroidetes bacterium]
MPSWYPSDDRDYGGTFFKEQAEALQEEGWNITVAYVETRSVRKIIKDRIYRSWTPGFFKINTPLREYRYRIYNYFMKIPFGKEYLIYRKLKWMIYKIEKEEGKIDLIHLHSFLSHGYAVRRICKSRNIKYLLTEHFSGIAQGFVKRYQKEILRKTLAQADKLFAVGPGLVKDLGNYSTKKIDIIPNMVNTDLFEIKNKSRSELFVFLSIGSLEYKKGFDLLIKSFDIVYRSNKAVRLIIVGEGSKRNELMKLVESLDLANSITFMGK